MAAAPAPAPAPAVEGAGFWLPSEFFEDSLILDNKENLHKKKNDGSDSDSDFCFPSEFPYDFDAESSPHFEKWWAMSTSPQSTLTHGRYWLGSSNASPNGVYSPPTTPLGADIDAVGDLIYRAAGQVAKLKLNATDTRGPTKHEVLMVPPRAQNQFHPALKHSNRTFLQNIYLQQHIMKQQKQGSRMWYAEPQAYQIRSGRPAGGLMGQDGWSVKQNPTRAAGSGAGDVVLGGSRGGAAAVKRARAGTGVFLPRRYGSGYDSHADSSDSRKKTGSAFVPERNAHALNKSFNDMNGVAQTQPKCGSRGLISDYDLLMARRNALMLQHQRSSLVEQYPQMTCGGRVCLPQEWTY